MYVLKGICTIYKVLCSQIVFILPEKFDWKPKKVEKNLRKLKKEKICTFVITN